MRYIDYGLSVMDSAVLEPYPANMAFDLADVLCNLAKAHNLAGYEAEKRFFEIGSPEGLVETERYLKGKTL